MGITLEEAMQQNKAFRAAFDDKEEANRTSRKSSDQKLSRPPIIIQSSQNPVADAKVVAAPHGLVSAVTQAYNAHHNLIIRPDDIWQAILTQFSFYVNANAEKLRDMIVDFQGKMTLVVETSGTLFTVDFGDLANSMVDEQIIKNIKDPDVAQWLLPNFTTTTPSDRVAASVSVMSTLQAYFEYVFSLRCGIPQVTLEGTVQDWQTLRQKLNRLPNYDLEDKLMTKWYDMLTLVIDEMLSSVLGKPNLDFWDTICHHHGGGSGPTFLSGWVTVFACFTKDGKWQGTIGTPHHPSPLFPYKSSTNPMGPSSFSNHTSGKQQYPSIDTKDLPVGACTVPVLVDDNGTKYDTQMLAGQVAYEAVEGDTIRPRTDWCIAYTGDTNQREYKHGEILANPEKMRTEIEMRKNEGDRLRRQRLKDLGLSTKGTGVKPGVSARGPLPPQYQHQHGGHPHYPQMGDIHMSPMPHPHMHSPQYLQSPYPHMPPNYGSPPRGAPSRHPGMPYGMPPPQGYSAGSPSRNVPKAEEPAQNEEPGSPSAQGEEDQVVVKTEL